MKINEWEFKGNKESENHEKNYFAHSTAFMFL
jgi:hypothetical protein